MTSFSGEHGMAVYRALVIASGLRLYAKTGIRPNAAYTPKAMMAAAEGLLGQKFKARDYLGAAKALSTFAELHAPAARVLGEIQA
jgi:hypothetical protein